MPLSVYIAGLGMVLPDKYRKVVHVLFPRHQGGNDQHHMRAAFRRSAVSNFVAGDGIEFEWGGVAWVEVDLTETDNQIGSPGDSATYDLKGKLINVPGFSNKKVVPNRFLDITKRRHGALTARLLLFRGSMGEAQVYTPIQWMLDGATNPVTMANGACWEITEAPSSIDLTIESGKTLKLDRLAGNDAIIFSHSLDSERPSRWPTITEIDTNGFQEGSTPSHFGALHALTFERKPTPRLKYVGISEGSRLPVQRFPCQQAAPFMAALLPGIHPVTCILAGGDPNDPNDPDDPPPPSEHADDHRHVHLVEGINPYDRSRASVSS